MGRQGGGRGRPAAVPAGNRLRQPGTVLVAYSVYYVAIQFLSEHRLTWVNLSAGWFCVPGHAPAVDPWEALTLYPLAAFATVGLRRTC